MEELRKHGKILHKGGWCGHIRAFLIHSEMSPLVLLGKYSNQMYKEAQQVTTATSVYLTGKNVL